MGKNDEEFAPCILKSQFIEENAKFEAKRHECERMY